jgi:NAD(P)H-flavin reductase/hemoglobin-like flavoprotein
VAIALDGGFPEESAGRAADAQRPSVRGHRSGEQHEPPPALTGIYPADKTSGAADHAAQELVRTESAAADDPGPPVAAAPEFDARLMKESFAHVMADPQASMEYLFAYLFAHGPELRALFPLAMSGLRERVFAALARLVWSMDTPESCAAFLRQLGQDHRKFGVREKHHKAFSAALLATVEHFSGPEWTVDTKAAWESALEYAGITMHAAAQEDGRTEPPWWLGEVIQHDRRKGAIAVLSIRPDQPLAYRPGQYVDVQVPRWPRQWRSYSVANAPRRSGVFDLHVRAIPGGMVSNALVHHAGAGDTVLLGRARGEMTLPPQGNRDLLCIAGGTGLAPIKAILEAVIDSTRHARPRKMTLLFGARRQAELYDLGELRALQSVSPALSVLPVVSHEAGFDGLTGMLPDIVASRDDIEDCEIFISGPVEMVAETERALAGRVAAEHVHHDPLSELSAS